MRRTTYLFLNGCDSISQAHRDRYPALKNILQRNIEKSPKLSDFASKISYELRLCGPCLADAVPSIVVFCPLEKLKKLKSLLTEPHIRSQFEPQSESPNSVCFGLYFWGEPTEMLAFHEVTVVIPGKQDTGGVIGDATANLVPWGIHIIDRDKGEKSTATMLCVIQVAGARFGLTTAHAFDHSITTSPAVYNMDSDDSDTEDDEYDTGTKGNQHGKVITNFHPASPLEHEVEVRTGEARVLIPHDDTSEWVQEHANLDWALVDLGFEKTSTVATAADQLPIVVNHLPQQCLHVLVITREHPAIPAILYNIPSYMGGVKGSPVAEVWTIGCIPENIHIQKGDSGSIVIDARSGQLYGMVVAANPFGDIHIVPFTAILAQVKELFETQDVSVLYLPRDFSPTTVMPGVEVNKVVPEQHIPEMVVDEDETAPEAGRLTGNGSFSSSEPRGRGDNVGPLNSRRPGRLIDEVGWFNF